MKINVSELREKLSRLMPGLSGRSPIKDIKHFAFVGGEIVTYNDQVCIGISFKCDFSCSIPADELISILSGIEEDEVEMILEGNLVKFNSPSTKAKISILEESQLLKMIESLDIPEKGWKPIPKDFIKAISLCVFSTSKDMTMGALNCVCIQGDQVLSSDTFRISNYKMKEKMDSFLIPSVAVKDLIEYPIIQYSIDNSWIHFEDENGLIFSSRILLGDYPNILDYLNLEAITIEIPAKLKDILPHMDIFTRNDFEINKKIKIKINNGELFCEASNQSGEVQKKIDIIYKGEEIEFWINPIFLSQILEKSTIMKISSDRRKALFLSGQFKHLMGLIG